MFRFGPEPVFDRISIPIAAPFPESVCDLRNGFVVVFPILRLDDSVLGRFDARPRDGLLFDHGIIFKV